MSQPQLYRSPAKPGYLRMYPGIRRIDIHTQVMNQEQFVRYRVMFPTSLESGHDVQEIAFGSIERPANQEFPRRTGSIIAPVDGGWRC